MYVVECTNLYHDIEVAAGRNKTTLGETKWKAVTERDYVGYLAVLIFLRTSIPLPAVRDGVVVQREVVVAVPDQRPGPLVRGERPGELSQRLAVVQRRGLLDQRELRDNHQRIAAAHDELVVPREDPLIDADGGALADLPLVHGWVERRGEHAADALRVVREHQVVPGVVPRAPHGDERVEWCGRRQLGGISLSKPRLGKNSQKELRLR